MSTVFVRRVGWFRWEATKPICVGVCHIAYGRTRRGALRNMRRLLSPLTNR